MNILVKMEKFHEKKIKTHHHGKMNTSKGVIRNKDLPCWSIDK